MGATEKSPRRKLEKASSRKVLPIPAGKKSVVLGVTGSIAAYKSAELASQLVKQGHEVFVVMTQDATEFISPLTLQTLSKNPVMISFFDEKESWRPGHIELADRANLLLIAPALPLLLALAVRMLPSNDPTPSVKQPPVHVKPGRRHCLGHENSPRK